MSGYKPLSEENKKKWEELQPEIQQCLEANLTIGEFWVYMGWDNREPWYNIKPPSFHWDHERIRVQRAMQEQRKFVKLEDMQEQKQEQENTMQSEIDKRNAHIRKTYHLKKEIFDRFGVTTFRDMGCKSMRDYKKKLKSGIIYKKFPHVKPHIVQEQPPEPQPKSQPKSQSKPEKVIVPPVKRVTAEPIAPGKVLLLVCDTTSLSSVLQQIKGKV